MAFGTPDDPICYYHITAIAIYMVQKILDGQTLGRDQMKLSKKKTDVKIKIVERFLVMRKIINGYYVLDQHRLLTMIHNVWGSVSTTHTIHQNDCSRIFGLIMTIINNRFMYQRLTERMHRPPFVKLDYMVNIYIIHLKFFPFILSIFVTILLTVKCHF